MVNFTTKLIIGAGFVCIAAFAFDTKTSAADKPPERVFQVPEHVLIQLRDEVEQLRKDTRVAQAEADMWENRYRTAKDCVHQHAAEQRPVLSCFKVESPNGTYNPEQQDF